MTTLQHKPLFSKSGHGGGMRVKNIQKSTHVVYEWPPMLVSKWINITYVSKFVAILIC